MKSKQQKTTRQLLKENQRLQSKLLDVQNSLSKLRDNSQSLTDLIHVSWEGMRTESVGYDEIQNAAILCYRYCGIYIFKRPPLYPESLQAYQYQAAA